MIWYFFGKIYGLRSECKIQMEYRWLWILNIDWCHLSSWWKIIFWKNLKCLVTWWVLKFLIYQNQEFSRIRVFDSKNFISPQGLPKSNPILHRCLPLHSHPNCGFTQSTFDAICLLEYSVESCHLCFVAQGIQTWPFPEKKALLATCWSRLSLRPLCHCWG